MRTFTQGRYKQIRNTQRDALDQLSSPLYYNLVSAPTGVGKSGIALGFGEKIKSPLTVVTTATLSLQDQYVHDFPWAVTLKGRGNFKCTLPGFGSAAEAPCTMFPDYVCDSLYYKQEEDFQDADTAITNYALYLSDLLYGRRWAVRPPGLLVCDEAHRLLDMLTSAETIEVDCVLADKLGYPVSIPTLAGLTDWAMHNIKTLKKEASAQVAAASSRAAPLFKLYRQACGIMGVRDTKMITIATGDTFKAAPLWPQYSALMMKESATYMLLMSATLGDPETYRSLFKWDAAKLVELESPFESDRWPVYYQPVVALNVRSSAEAWNKMADACHDKMHNTEEKGIIHVASYEQATRIIRRMGRCKECRQRLVGPRVDESRAETIIRYRTGPNQWMVHPYVGEGESFDDDQCRIQIIAKLRYPDLGSPLVKARAEDGPAGQADYFSATARYTAQTAGRAMRSEQDYCETYIYDGSFGGLYDRNRAAFPRWFQRQLR